MIHVEQTKAVRTKLGPSGTNGELKAEEGRNRRIELTVYHLNGEQTSLDIEREDLYDFIAVLSEFTD